MNSDLLGNSPLFTNLSTRFNISFEILKETVFMESPGEEFSAILERVIPFLTFNSVYIIGDFAS